MKPTFFAALAALCALPTVGSANLLSNPGFETYAPGAFSGYTKLDAGNTDVTGWLVGGVSTDIVEKNSYPVHSGNYAIDLAGTPGPGSMWQNVTAPADMYTVSFWGLSNQSGDNAKVVATFGVTQMTFTLDGTYKQYSFTAPASGFTSFGLSTLPTNTTNGNVFVDDASIQAVPEPTSMAALGLGALGLLRRRARKA